MSGDRPGIRASSAPRRHAVLTLPSRTEMAACAGTCLLRVPTMPRPPSLRDGDQPKHEDEVPRAPLTRPPAQQAEPVHHRFFSGLTAAAVGRLPCCSLLTRDRFFFFGLQLQRGGRGDEDARQGNYRNRQHSPGPRGRRSASPSPEDKHASRITEADSDGGSSIDYSKCSCLSMLTPAVTSALCISSLW